MRNERHHVIVLLSQYPGGESSICLMYSEVSCVLGIVLTCLAGPKDEGWADNRDFGRDGEEGL